LKEEQFNQLMDRLEAIRCGVIDVETVAEDIKKELSSASNNSDMVPCPKFHPGGKCHGNPWRTACGSEPCMVRDAL
jgi:hypothetical protein